MEYSTETTAMSGIAIVMFMLFGLAAHIFFGYCFKRIAEKAGETDTGIWWIPIVNYLLVLRAANKPGWWLVLLLIPFVNFIVLFIVWIEVSNRLGKGTGWGVVAVIFSIVGVPYLAFSDDTSAAIA
ncbi:MAG TPA: DUF5684 domain-containing protein [Candidatus Kapabacteria bacterium]|jgi:hypothetical protein|nr:DUF5684 domain-containing protein [Candidatus Kapabacteria bacterium]